MKNPIVSCSHDGIRVDIFDGKKEACTKVDTWDLQNPDESGLVIHVGTLILFISGYGHTSSRVYGKLAARA